MVQRDVEEKGNQEREINKNKMRKQKTHCTAETKNDRYQAVLIYTFSISMDTLAANDIHEDSKTQWALE